MKRKLQYLLLAVIGLPLIAAVSVTIRNNTNGLLLGIAAADKIGFHGVAPVIQRSGSAQNALTDSTVGSTADNILADGLTATAVTDSGGGAAANGTIEVVTAPTSETDSSGGAASATLAAETLPTALTHSFGTADNTLDDVTGSFSQTILNNNFKELTTAQAANRAQLSILRDSVASLAARQAQNRTAIIALTDALKELSTAANLLVADDNTQNNNDAKITKLLNELRAADVQKGLIKGGP